MEWNLTEAMEYYRRLGAPEDQNALIGLLREIQQELGSIPKSAPATIADGYHIKEALVLALIRRIPTLRLAQSHTLQLCAGSNCGKHTQLAAYAEELQIRGICTLRFVPCMRLCGKGPNIRWDGQIHHRATVDLLRQLAETE